MDQPPPILGQVAHPGLAAEAAAFAATDQHPAGWAPLAAQMLYGYVLVNVTGSAIDSDPSGTMMMPGSTLHIHTILDDQDRKGLPIFTSQSEIHQTLSPEDLSTASGMAQPADTIFSFLEAMDMDFLMINPGSSRLTISREDGLKGLGGLHDVGMRAALELGAATRRTVVNGLAESDGDLMLAANPESIGTHGSFDHVQLRTSVSPTGTPLISVYTSAVEVALRHDGDVPVKQSYDTVLAGALNGAYDGIILNPGTSWIILTRAEVQTVAKRRAKLAAKAAKTAAKAKP